MNPRGNTITKHKKQHFVPKSYLKTWCDPLSPEGQTPYVWRISKDGKHINKKAPKNIFYKNNMYTIETINGGRDIHLEKSLSRIESEFVKIRNSKLDNKRKLSKKELLFLCMFIAAMYGRTEAYSFQQSSIWQEVVEFGEKIQSIFDNASPEERKQMSTMLTSPMVDKDKLLTPDQIKSFAKEPIQNFLPQTVATTASYLFKMPYRIYEAPKGYCFITSDNPCIWYDPACYIKPRPFGAGGLISPTLEISMPISPNQYLFFGKKLNTSGNYFLIEYKMVDYLNRLTRRASHEFIISNNDKANPSWF